MSFIIGAISFFVILPILVWATPLFYKYWKKAPHIVQYILFLPISLLIGVIFTRIMSVTFFRDMLSSKGFWMEYVFPFTECVFQVLIVSILIVFLVPKYEKNILRLCLAILYVGINIASWVLITMYSKLILNQEMFLSFCTVVIACLVFWKSDYFISLKRDYAE